MNKLHTILLLIIGLAPFSMNAQTQHTVLDTAWNADGSIAYYVEARTGAEPGKNTVVIEITAGTSELEDLAEVELYRNGVARFDGRERIVRGISAGTNGVVVYEDTYADYNSDLVGSGTLPGATPFYYAVKLVGTEETPSTRRTYPALHLPESPTATVNEAVGAPSLSLTSEVYPNASDTTVIVKLDLGPDYSNYQSILAGALSGPLYPAGSKPVFINEVLLDSDSDPGGRGKISGLEVYWGHEGATYVKFKVPSSRIDSEGKSYMWFKGARPSFSTGTVVPIEFEFAADVVAKITQPTTELTCTTTTITLDASGSTTSGTASYAWTGGGTGSTLDVTAPGTYSVTVTDVDNVLTDIASVDITEGGSVANITQQTTALTSAVTSITLDASGSTTSGVASYEWSDGSIGSTLSVTEGGLYSVTVTDAGTGCTDDSSVRITKDVEVPVLSGTIHTALDTAWNADGSIAYYVEARTGAEPGKNTVVIEITAGTSELEDLAEVELYRNGVARFDGRERIVRGISAGTNGVVVYEDTYADYNSDLVGSGTLPGATPFYYAVKLVGTEETPSTRRTYPALHLPESPTATVNEAVGAPSLSLTSEVYPNALDTTVIVKLDLGPDYSNYQSILAGALSGPLYPAGSKPVFINEVLLDSDSDPGGRGKISGLEVYWGHEGATYVKFKVPSSRIDSEGKSYMWFKGARPSFSTGTVVPIEFEFAADVVAKITQPTTELTCTTTTITLDASGSTTSGTASYAWTGGGTGSTLDVTAPGTYSVTVTDVDNVLTDIASVDITEGGSVAHISQPTTALTSAVTSITLDASGSTTSGVASYEWSDGSIGSTLSVTEGGLYSVTVTDAGTGCTDDSSVRITKDVEVPVLSGTIHTALDTAWNADGSIAYYVEARTGAEPGKNTVVIEITAGTSELEDLAEVELYRNGVARFDGRERIVRGISAGTNGVVVYEDTYADYNSDLVGSGTLPGATPFYYAVKLVGTEETPSTRRTYPALHLPESPTATVNEAVGAPSLSLTSEVYPNALDTTVIVKLDLGPDYSNYQSILAGALSGPLYPAGSKPVFINEVLLDSDSDPGGRGKISGLEVYWGHEGATYVKFKVPSSRIDSEGKSYMWFKGARPSFSTGTVVPIEFEFAADVVAKITQPTTELTCTTTTITLDASGSTTSGTASYAWTGGGTGSTLDVTAPGTYSVTVTDVDNVLTDIASVMITENTTDPTATITQSTTELTCETTTITLDASSSTTTGTASYTWTGGGTDATQAVTSVGTYSVTVTDSSNGCTAVKSVEITENINKPNATITQPSTALTCETTTITLDASTSTITGTPSYTWTGGSTASTLDVTAEGVYSVTVTDSANGCSDVSTVTITQDNTDLTATITQEATELTCLKTSITLNAMASITANTLSYAWSDESTTATLDVTTAGTYSVTVTDSGNGCSAAATRIITENATDPTARITQSTTELTCVTTSITLDAGSSTTTGTATYAWTGGSTASTLAVSTPGTYAVTVTDVNNGCTDVASVTITQDITDPTARITQPTTELTCVTTSITLDAGSSTTTGTATYAWTGGSTASTLAVSTAGTYAVTVTDVDNGCTDVASITITQDITDPTARITQPTTELTGVITSITLDASSSVTTGSASYAWTDGGNNATLVVTAAGTYAVTVTDSSNGCTDVETVVITQGDLPEPPVLTGTIHNVIDTAWNSDGSIAYFVNAMTGAVDGKNTVVLTITPGTSPLADIFDVDLYRNDVARFNGRERIQNSIIVPSNGLIVYEDTFAEYTDHVGSGTLPTNTPIFYNISINRTVELGGRANTKRTYPALHLPEQPTEVIEEDINSDITLISSVYPNSDDKTVILKLDLGPDYSYYQEVLENALPGQPLFPAGGFPFFIGEIFLNNSDNISGRTRVTDAKAFWGHEGSAYVKLNVDSEFINTDGRSYLWMKGGRPTFSTSTVVPIQFENTVAPPEPPVLTGTIHSVVDTAWNANGSIAYYVDAQTGAEPGKHTVVLTITEGTSELGDITSVDIYRNDVARFNGRERIQKSLPVASNGLVVFEDTFAEYTDHVGSGSLPANTPMYYAVSINRSTDLGGRANTKRTYPAIHLPNAPTAEIEDVINGDIMLISEVYPNAADQSVIVKLDLGPDYSYYQEVLAEALPGEPLYPAGGKPVFIGEVFLNSTSDANGRTRLADVKAFWGHEGSTYLKFNVDSEYLGNGGISYLWMKGGRPVFSTGIPIPIDFGYASDVVARITQPTTTLTCEITSITLDASTSETDGTASYAWTGGSSASTLDVTTAGTYSVTVTDGSSGDSDVATVTITDGGAVARISQPTTALTASVTSIILDASSSTTQGAASYIWSTGSGNSAIAATTAGTYSVTVTDGTSGCSDVATVRITEDTQPPVLTGTIHSAVDTAWNANGSIAYYVDAQTGAEPGKHTVFLTITEGTSELGDISSVDIYRNDVARFNGRERIQKSLPVGTNGVVVFEDTFAEYTDHVGSGSLPANTPMYYAVSINRSTELGGRANTKRTYPAIHLPNAPTAEIEDVVNGDITLISEVYPNSADQTVIVKLDLGPDYSYYQEVLAEALPGEPLYPAGGKPVFIGEVFLNSTSDANGRTRLADVRAFWGHEGSTYLKFNVDSEYLGNGGISYLWMKGGRPAFSTGIPIPIDFGYASDVVARITQPTTTLTCETTSITLDASTSETDGTASYAWTGGSSASTLDVTTAGTYHVTVTDGSSGDSDVATVTITDGGAVARISQPTTALTASVSSIILDASSSTTQGAASYIWSTGSGNSAISVTTAGTYSVTVTDGTSGCSDVATVRITEDTQPPVLTGTIHSAVDTAWNANGSIAYYVDAQTGAEPGKHTVFLTITEGTSELGDISSVDIYRNDVARFNGRERIQKSLPVGTNGVVVFEDTFAEYTDHVGSGSLPANTPMYYAVSINRSTALGDRANTKRTYPAIHLPNAPTAEIEDVINGDITLISEVYPNAADQSVIVKLDLGPDYSYYQEVLAEALPGEPLYPAGGKPVFIGEVFLNSTSDANGRTRLADVRAFWGYEGSAYVKFNVDSEYLGNGGISYLWMKGGRPAFSTGIPIPIDFGYASDVVARITQPTTTLTCETTSITLDASTSETDGTARYGWTGGSSASTLDVTTAGTYSVTVTDVASGLSDVATVTITQDIESPTATITQPATTLTGGRTSITLDARSSITAGTASYVWSDGSTAETLVVSEAGTYTVTVTDSSNGCSAEASVTITEEIDDPTAFITQSTTVLTCLTTNIILDARSSITVGTASYVWNDGSTADTLVVSEAGAYSATVTDSRTGRSDVATVTITQDIVSPTVTITQLATTLTGERTSITLDASSSITAGTGNYVWSDGSTEDTLVVSEVGTYTVMVTDGTNGCSAEASVTITEEIDDPTAVITQSTTVLTCVTTNVTLDAGTSITVGTASYVWSDDSTADTFVVSEPGTYAVTVTDSRTGRSDVAMVTITQDIVSPTATITQPAITLTGGRTYITLDASSSTTVGAASYVWSDDSTADTLVVSEAGTYTVMVTDGANGCSAEASVTITEEIDDPTAVITQSTTVLTCVTNNIVLDVRSSITVGTASYVWSDGSTADTLVVSEAGAYSATVTDSSTGRNDVATVIITNDLTRPTATITHPATSLTGVRTSITLDARNSITVGTAIYVWSDGSTADTLMVSDPGIYSVTVTDGANGCSAIASVTITEDIEDPTAVITQSTTVLTCATTDVTLDAGTSITVGTASYVWNDGSTADTFVVSEPGTYAVTVTDSTTGRSNATTVIITQDIVSPTATITQPATTLTETRTSIILDASSSVTIGTESYLWSDGSTDDILVVSDPGTFFLTVTDNANGCSDETSVTITQDDGPLNSEQTVHSVIDTAWNADGSIAYYVDATTVAVDGKNTITLSITEGTGVLGEIFDIDIYRNNTSRFNGRERIQKSISLPSSGVVVYEDTFAEYTDHVGSGTLPANTPMFYAVSINRTDDLGGRANTKRSYPAIYLPNDPVASIENDLNDDVKLICEVYPNVADTTVIFKLDFGPDYSYFQQVLAAALPGEPLYPAGSKPVFIGEVFINNTSETDGRTKIDGATVFWGHEGSAYVKLKVDLSHIGSGGISYLWLKGGRPSFSTDTPISVDFGFDLDTSIDDFVDIEFQVYPNPTSGLINIELTESIDRINVFSTNGRLVFSKIVDKHFRGLTQLDLGDQRPGIYFLQLQSQQNIVAKKIVIE